MLTIPSLLTSSLPSHFSPNLEATNTKSWMFTILSAFMSVVRSLGKVILFRVLCALLP